MPLHPAAPEDLVGLVSAYQQTAQAVVDLGLACSDADFDRPTAFAGWTVKDQIAHVVGIESWLHTGEGAPRVVPRHDRIRGDLAQFSERSVELRRPMRGSKVVEELQTVVKQRVDELSRPELTVDTITRGVHGPTALAESLRLRTMDIWVHEQDIRQAVGRPGNLDAGGAALFMDALFTQLPRLVAKEAGIPPGNVVIIDCTGPVMGRAGVWVEEGVDGGEPRGIPLFSGVAHDGDPRDVFTTLTLSTDGLTRRAAGRGTLEDIHFTVAGDEDVARRVLENLVIDA